MREILFRGKSKDTGEWVYGNYMYNLRYNTHMILHYECACQNGTKPLPTDYSLCDCDVDPETVCQYTGLTDKNGRNIFEGDIIEVCTFGFNSERFITEVIYEKCAFRLKNGRNMFYHGQSDFTRVDDAKVAGNVFDNPELLEGGEVE